MKKTILLLCVILALLLAGCGKTTQRDVADPGQGPQSVDTTDVVYADVVTPKTFELRVPPEDRNQAFYCTSFVETPEVYYYGQNRQGKVFIYFCPRGGDTFRPLCSKPNCKHNDQNCNAYAGNAFAYYDGSIYAAEYKSDTINILKLNLDGTDHRRLTTLELDASMRNHFTFQFHRGKLIVWNCLSDLEKTDHILVLDLSDNSLKDYPQTDKIILIEKFYENKLYGVVMERDVGADASDTKKLVEFDLVTGEVRSLAEKNIASLYATASTLYYFEPDMSALPGYEASEAAEPGFRELDLKTGTTRDCGMPVEDILSACYDDDYIYADSFRRNNGRDETLYILSRDYVLLDQIDLEGISIAAVTSDRIYLYDATTASTINYYIDKAQIGSGALTLVPIETVG